MVSTRNLRDSGALFSGAFAVSFRDDVPQSGSTNSQYIYIHIYLAPQWPLFLKVKPLQNKAFSNQNKGHLGSRFIYHINIVYSIFIYSSQRVHLPLPAMGKSFRDGESWVVPPSWETTGKGGPLAQKISHKVTSGFNHLKWLAGLSTSSQNNTRKKTHQFGWWMT